MTKHLSFALAAGLMAGSVSAEIVNPNFSPEQTYAGTTEEFAGPDGWILRDLEDRRAVVSSVEFARSGSRVFWFSTPTAGFGDNKLDQCIPVDAAPDFAFAFSAWTLRPDSDLRARVNIESYPTEADCDARSNRLDNEDFDFRIEGTAAQWQEFAQTFAVNSGADFVRLSLRLRDRSGPGGAPAEPPVQVFFDDVRVIGASLVNGNFADTTISEAQFAAGEGPFGWVLNAAGELGVVVPQAAAVDGSAFGFNQLFTAPEPDDRGFGDNSLEQCFAIDSFRNRLVAAGVSVWTSVSDSDLRVRLNLDTFPDEASCLARDNSQRLRQIQTDFRTSDLQSQSWNRLQGDAFVVANGEAFARIALRARDRRVGLTAGNSPTVLFDQVRFTEQAIAVPVLGLPIALLLALLMLVPGLIFAQRQLRAPAHTVSL
ncbi:MAG: hypothetical protein ACXIUM_03705 [Wenzhouxiangella sp.]